MTRSLLSFLVILLLPALLCSCLKSSPIADPLSEQGLVPHAWSSLGYHAEGPAGWLDSFNDPQLNELVAECLQRNHSLQSAVARVATAKAKAAQAGAERAPTAELDLNAERRRSNPGASHTTASQFGLNGSVRWQLDLWNRLDHQAQAATLEANATEDDYRALRLSLAAAVARGWYRLAEAEQQLRLAEQTELSFSHSVDIVEERYRSGLSSALDMRLARSELESARSLREQRLRQRDSERRTLELLLGRYPAGRIEGPAQLPYLPLNALAGLPSGLLERRPDLRAERGRIQAAGRRFDAAQRNYLPQFLLTTSAGTVSDKLYQLLDWDDLLWSLGAALTQTIFDGGRNQAERDQSRALLDEQLATYAAVVLTAFSEVELALAAESTLKNEELALSRAVDETHEAHLLAEQRYRQGLEDAMALLITQRRAFTARSNALRLNRQRLENRIDLHLALGGSLSENPLPIIEPENP